MSMPPATAPPALDMVLANNGVDPASYAWHCFLALAQPYAARCSRVASVTHPPLDLVPEGAVVRLTHEDDRQAIVVAAANGAVVCLQALSQSTSLDVAAETAERAHDILRSMSDRIAAVPDGAVRVTMWQDFAPPWTRHLVTPSWAEVARNYSPAVAAELAPIMGLTEITDTGRLLVWTGEPGTGKTTAIRALLKEWAPWCQAHLVTDPEQLFRDATYLRRVLSSPLAGRARPRLEVAEARSAWSLFVCEDADDFIAAEARQRTGSGVGRLLNVADGLLGQGLNTVILLTSNLPIRRLDPALLRPGRCLARIEFERFTPAEARRWLGDRTTVVPEEGMTLAELYERAGEVTRYGQREGPSPRVGTYL